MKNTVHTFRYDCPGYQSYAGAGNQTLYSQANQSREEEEMWQQIEEPELALQQVPNNQAQSNPFLFFNFDDVQLSAATKKSNLPN